MSDEQDFENPHEGLVSTSAAKDGREVAFVTHPVLPEIKKKIVRSGFRIIDARFAGKGDTIWDGQTGEEVKARRGGKAEGGAKKTEE